MTEYQSPNFQTAVKNFYASFLAARHVAKQSNQFFGVIAPNSAGIIHSYNTITLSRSTSIKRISKELGIKRDVLESLNPSLNKVVWNDKALVPKKYNLKLPYQEYGWDGPVSKMNALPAEYEVPGFVWHRVKSGDTACGIANRYGASCSALLKLNGLNKRGTIYAGRRLKVPTNNGGIGVAAGNIIGANSTGAYRVKSGDTSCSIARRHTMKCDEFLAVNGLTMNSIIRIGQTVKVSSSDAWHVVRKGQSACGIAESYRVSCSALLNANRLNLNSIIQVGQRLRVPQKG